MGDAGAPRHVALSAELASIYQDTLLDHYRRPRNRGALTDATGRAERRNPLCGDMVSVEIRVEDGVVRAARFTGVGCSIALATASMMTVAVTGLSRDAIDALCDRLDALLHGDAEAAADDALGELRALTGVARLPARVKCAQLPWGALMEALGPAGSEP